MFQQGKEVPYTIIEASNTILRAGSGYGGGGVVEGSELTTMSTGGGRRFPGNRRTSSRRGHVEHATAQSRDS
jgi:hypothetical protein